LIYQSKLDIGCLRLDNTTFKKTLLQMLCQQQQKRKLLAEVRDFMRLNYSIHTEWIYRD